MIYLCVDGGQTKTDVFLLSAEGVQLESWKEAPLLYPSRPEGEARLRGVVRRTCEELKRRLAGKSKDIHLSMCFSLTGYHEGDEYTPALVREEVQTVFTGFERAYTIPDYVGNWFAATKGTAGIVIIAGGGAVAYGRNADSVSLRTGGWGHLLGDEGSGYWIGLQAVKATLKSDHEMIEKTALTEKVMRTFGVDGELALLRQVYSGSIREDDFAALTPVVVSAAEEGDEVANQILDGAADHLSQMTTRMIDGLGNLPIHLSGGVFRVPAMQERFSKQLSSKLKRVEIVAGFAEPVNGLLLAAKGGARDIEADATHDVFK